MMKKNLSVLLFIFFILLVTGCGKQKNADHSMFEQSDAELSVGMTASLYEGEWSLCENGILFSDSNLLKFYDFATEKSYVLCGAVNCKHNNESCPSWIANSSYMFGTAIYQGKLYYFIDDHTSFKLVSQNITGDQKKVLWQMNRSDISDEAFSINSITNVVYHKGYAWAEISYFGLKDANGEEYLDTATVYGINLENGDVIAINELPNIENVKNGECCYYTSLVYADDGCIMADTVYPSEKTEELPREAYVLYDIEKGDKRTVHSGEQVPIIKYGDFRGYMPSLELFAVYDGKFVCTIATKENVSDRANNQGLYLFDPMTDSFDILCEDLYGFPFFEGKNISSRLINGKVVLTAELLEDGEHVNVYAYDLEKRESVLAYESTKALPNRIFDQTKDQFIIRCKYDGLFSDGFKSYLMSKEDYFKGNFDAMKKITVK